MAKGKKRFNISIDIYIIDEKTNDRKSYSLETTYEGEASKLALDVIIDGWFIENNIDKNLLVSFNAHVRDCDADYICCF